MNVKDGAKDTAGLIIWPKGHFHLTFEDNISEGLPLSRLRILVYDQDDNPHAIIIQNDPVISTTIVPLPKMFRMER